jgi:hypothetical protein
MAVNLALIHPNIYRLSISNNSTNSKWFQAASDVQEASLSI